MIHCPINIRYLSYILPLSARNNFAINVYEALLKDDIWKDKNEQWSGREVKNFPENREPLQNSRPQKGDKKQLSEGSRMLGVTVLRHCLGNLVLRICAHLKYCNFSILRTDIQDIQAQNFETEQYIKAWK